MIKDSNYERIYTGSSIQANYFKGLLEAKDIHAVLRNDFESGLRGGFGGGIPDHVQLFVQKSDVVLAKRTIDQANEEGIPEEILAEQAEQSRLADQDKAKKTSSKPLVRKNNKRSKFNLVLNIGLVIYSGYRLYPLLEGEELPAWRIGLSAFIFIFCLGAIFLHFKRK